MAHSLRGSFRRSAAPVRRKTSWALGPRGEALAVITNTNNLFGTGSQSVQDGLTLVRTRGELLLYLTVGDTIDAGFVRVAAGIAVASENAFDIGVTAVMSPVTDIGWDGWSWYWTGSLRMAAASQFGEVPSAVRIPIDSKAMRKLKNTDVCYGVVETASEDVNASMSATLNTRMLVKLP